jgi:hypothetical protein
LSNKNAEGGRDEICREGRRWEKGDKIKEKSEKSDNPKIIN